MAARRTQTLVTIVSLAALSAFALAMTAASGAKASPAVHASLAAAPAPLYLSPKGSDSGKCRSLAKPCKSFARAYELAAPGATVHVGPGIYPPQLFAGGYQAAQPAGTKKITFKGRPGNRIRTLHSGSPNMTFDGIHADAGRKKTSGAVFENNGANNVTFKNGSIGNVTDEKGALVSGNRVTFSNTLFHDVYLATEGVHNECMFAINTPGLTVRNSTFKNCATMDLFFTFGDWWDQDPVKPGQQMPPAYGGVTLIGNKFFHSTCDGCAGQPKGWHYYGLLIARVAPPTGSNPAANLGAMNGWTIKNNWFENNVEIGQPRAQGKNNLFCGNTGKGYEPSWSKRCPS